MSPKLSAYFQARVFLLGLLCIFSRFFCSFRTTFLRLGFAFGKRKRSHGFDATAGDAANIAFAMGHLALHQAPQAIVGGDEGLPGKPEPAIFLEVARRLNVAPEHCLVFEDAPLGIEAARRAGMRAVAVCTLHRAEELAGLHVLAAIEHYQGLADAPWFKALTAAPAGQTQS